MDVLLLESGDSLLTEPGGLLLLEDMPPTRAEFDALAARVTALEDADFLLLEGLDSPDPDPAPSADRVLADGENFPDGFTVPAGEVWAFDPDVTTTVQVGGNVVVEGTLEAKPSGYDVVHTLKFYGIDESAMVGGHTDTVLDTDVGLWVTGDGILDFQGTARAGWNRTGADPTWQPGDTVMAAPQGSWETTVAHFAPFTPGDPVPTVTAPDGTAHPTEVFNLTRNVRVVGGGPYDDPTQIQTVDGRPHVIFLNVNQPQTIRNVELRWVGPRTIHDRDGTNGLVGRYGLHFHLCGDGTQGTLVEQTVVRQAGNSAYVPHSSHGITFRDTVAFDTHDSAYWWDAGDETDDLLYDRAAVFGVTAVPDYRGYSLRGFELGRGTNMTVRDSVAVGVGGRKVNSGGFHWPSNANLADNNVWTFVGNVAHNCHTNGISSWQNDENPHVVQQFVSYRNLGAGVSHGAYSNAYVYRDGVTFLNKNGGIQQHAAGPITFEDMDVESIIIEPHTLASDFDTVYRDVRSRGGVTVNEWQGRADVIVFESTKPECDLSPDDFTVDAVLSDITVHNSDGSTFTVTDGS